mmetsp:Transcript_13236/g.22464  ORF Transcript_13236/g.22464 Transcript_13236/m.22464 type:complete len:81 (+) Transcript_13236:3-245(+)
MPPSRQMDPARRLGVAMSEYSSRHSNSKFRFEFEGGSSRVSRATENEDKWEDDPPQRSGENYQPPKERIYYADWTRALAI